MTYQERVLRKVLADPDVTTLDRSRTDLVRLVLAEIDRLRAELADLTEEASRLRDERNAYYRTATERWIELQKARAAGA